MLLLLACSTPSFNQDQNGLWLRRHWLHEAPSDAEVDTLVQTLKEKGIQQIYPFLGPPDAEGLPGWRDQQVLTSVDLEKARGFMEKMQAKAPEIGVYPWTGGILKQDIVLEDSERSEKWMDRVLSLPLAGVHLNVEPLPEQDAYLSLLHRWKERLGNRILSVAAYPPPTPLHPYADVHWSLPFLQKVCIEADDLVVMAYDTGLTTPAAYTRLVAEWTPLLLSLPSPEKGGCTVRIGLPTYEDDRPYHHPQAETFAAGLAGVLLGLQTPPPPHFRGIALYASWTTDAEEWTVYDRNWRHRGDVNTTLVDGK